MPGRLMVGRKTLDLAIMVRIHAGQQKTRGVYLTHTRCVQELYIIILVKPIRIVLLWAAIWGFWTALVRPIVGEPIWDFVERWANWGTPLALLFLLGLPKNLKDWLK